MELDELAQAARAVLERKHLVVSQGRVVRLGKPYIDKETGEAEVDDGRGEPLEDDAPVLQDIDRLLKIQERRARLLGLDAPQRVSIEAQQLGDAIGALLGALLTDEGDDDDLDDEEPHPDQG